MSKFWNRRTQQLSPYVPGEQPQDQEYIKLNTNESPYPPSQKVLDAMRDAVDSGLHLYPDPNAKQLKQAVAEYYKLDATNVFVGNGSDEVLAHIFAGLFVPEKPLLMPDISYSFYPVYAQLYGQLEQYMPLDEGFNICLEDYAGDNGGVIFANPNAPTSLALSLKQIEMFLQRNTKSVVVVDEAYVDFGGESAVALVKDYPNLVVAQTLSKSRSLAGLRVGFAIANEEIIEGLERVKNSFNSYPIDKVALAGATVAMQDIAGFEASRNAVLATRAWVSEGLAGLGFEVLPSAANFVFAKPSKLSAHDLYSLLKQRGVLVRHFAKPRIEDYLRITIGTDEKMQVLLAQIEAIQSVA